MDSELSLVADVGATNARFQVCSGMQLLGEPLVLPTTEYATSAALASAAIERLGLTDAVISDAVIAAAGPVDAIGNLTLTNTGMTFDASQMQQQLGCAVHLLNDFFALAQAIPHVQQTCQIGGRDAVASGAASKQVSNQVKAVLGPGSGLGMATLVPLSAAQGAARWQVVCGEGGHATLGIANHLDAEVWSVLSQQYDYISWETVLSGSGLTRLYAAMCAVWGSQPEALDASQISARGVTMMDPVCHQTLESFCGFLGTAAGDLAFTVGARGGVYIAGGIAPQIVEFMSTSPLRRRFDERGSMSGYVADIPVYVVLDDNPGLAGAMRYRELVASADQAID